jgi:glycyl-tRNA synthetase beta chain
MFHVKLGSVADKVERVARLARWLAEEVIPGADPRQTERAARLAKADLVTGMVGEFPELQGVIGGYIAERQGEPRAVCEAIRDHYKPVGQGDDVPSAPVTVAVGLADKLDSVCAFFGAGMPPSGSKDPFALRRSALGIIALIVDNNLRLPLTRVLQEASGSQPDAALIEFFADRLKVQQREAGVRHDLIDAVFALGGEDDLVRLLARVNALQGFVETLNGANLLAGYKRASNILKKEDWDPHLTSILDVPSEEAALAEALDVAGPDAGAAIAREDFRGAMQALASLRGPIDAFFDAVTVNAEDAGVRARRLSLLARFRDAVLGVADFSKIEG